jgi:hypothetical protein
MKGCQTLLEHDRYWREQRSCPCVILNDGLGTNNSRRRSIRDPDPAVDRGLSRWPRIRRVVLGPPGPGQMKPGSTGPIKKKPWPRGGGQGFLHATGAGVGRHRIEGGTGGVVLRTKAVETRSGLFLKRLTGTARAAKAFSFPIGIRVF